MGRLRWELEVVSSLLIDSSGARLRSAEGSWRIGNGAYCVNIQWPRVAERWCRYMYRIGDKYYGVRIHAEDSALAMEFELGKQ
jgi:hypothetical protein